MKVAAIQMVSGTQLQANLEAARVLLAQAADQGAELALLPEYFCLLGQRDTDKLGIQETFGSGPIQDFLADCARTLGLWLVGGTPAADGAGGRADGRRRAGPARLQQLAGVLAAGPVRGALRQDPFVPLRQRA